MNNNQEMSKTLLVEITEVDQSQFIDSRMSLKDSHKSSVSQEREQRGSVLTNNELVKSGSNELLDEIKSI